MYNMRLHDEGPRRPRSHGSRGLFACDCHSEPEATAFVAAGPGRPIYRPRATGRHEHDPQEIGRLTNTGTTGAGDRPPTLLEGPPG
jgi:hypothetical protein